MVVDDPFVCAGQAAATATVAAIVVPDPVKVGLVGAVVLLVAAR